MKAYNLHSVNDLSYEEVPMPQCASRWAIVKVKAAGICSSDVSRVFTKGTYHFPTIPGHEFSGVVESVKILRTKSGLESMWECSLSFHAVNAVHVPISTMRCVRTMTT